MNEDQLLQKLGEDIQKLINADTDNFLELGKLIGLNTLEHLAGANLRGTDLSNIDLSDADLSHADLSHADLSYANLVGANLTGVDLRGANLSNTRLGNNLGITDNLRPILEQKGAIFEDNPILTQLNQWFEGIFEEAWKAIDEIIPPQEDNFAWNGARGSSIIKRAKEINLGESVNNQSVALVINIRQRRDRKINVKTRIMTIDEQDFLFQGLRVYTNIDGKDIEAQATTESPYIEIKFNVSMNATFTINIALNEKNIIEEKFSI